MGIKKKVTLKDIAEATNLSIVTVSKVINHNSVTAAGKETTELINHTAKKLGYNRRSEIAEAVQKPVKLGIIVAHRSEAFKVHPFYYSLYNSIKKYAAENNMQIRFYNDLMMSASDMQYQSIIANHDVNSVIFLGELMYIEDSDINLLKSRFEHTISITPYYYSDSLSISNDIIIIDTYYSTKNVLNRLIKNGRKKILLLLGPTTEEMLTVNYDLWRSTAEGRALAYYEVMKENNIPLDKELIYNCDWDPETAHDTVDYLLKKNEVKFDAIFTGDDMMAIACMKALHKHKISIPEQVAVIGFNNQEFSKYTAPPLSSIEIDFDSIGSLAIELIRYRNSAAVNAPIKIMVPAKYIKKKSCGL